MRIIAGLIAILLVTGCTDKDKVPSGILEKEKMEKVLWDMIQADQYASNYLLRDSTRVNVKMETLKLYQEVFRLHQVSREEFTRSFAFYRDRPDLARGLFDSLLAKGNRLRTESYSRPQPAVTPAGTPTGTPTPKPPLIPGPVNRGKPLVPGPINRTKTPVPVPAIHPGPAGAPGFPRGMPSKAPLKASRSPGQPFLHLPGADSSKAGKTPLRPLL